MKAHTSKGAPKLKNTPKDMTIVTSSEKVDVVNKKGYDKVDSFQDANTIRKSTDKRLLL